VSADFVCVLIPSLDPELVAVLIVMIGLLVVRLLVRWRLCFGIVLPGYWHGAVCCSCLSDIVLLSVCVLDCCVCFDMDL